MHPSRPPRAKVATTSTLALSLTLTALVLLGAPSGAAADLIRPDASQSFPDLSGDIVGMQTYRYDPVTQTGTFQVSNTPTLLATGPKPSSEFYVNDPKESPRSQSLQVKLDSSGHLLNDSGNAYSLYGQVVLDGKTYSGLLLRGTPTQFGWAAQNPQAPTMSVYDVNMKLTGGLLQPFYGADAYLRIITEANSTFNGTFTTNFQGLKALTNVRAYNPPPLPVPEPSTVYLLLACGAGLLWKRRRQIRAVDLTQPED